MAEEFTSQQIARKAFELLAAGEDATIDLAQAALLIAAEEYPGLDIEHYLAKLDLLARRVRRELDLLEGGVPAHFPQERILEAMNHVLFEEEHFHGNRENYYDPRNSFFNEVLERHTGIPITLSLLYMEVGRRLGIQIDGIGLPWHFVTRCPLPNGVIYIDAYENGLLLSEQECRERVLNNMRSQAKFNPHWLEPVSHKQFLVRMLNNLKHIYVHTGDYKRALSACDRVLLLTPNSPGDLRDRGAIHLQLGYYARALRDLQTYVELVPQASDIKRVQRQIKGIRQIIALMN